jgi:DNA polymerase III epsilon subunit-like protein
MKYLFFDCECANCYDHKGKICSFGYVLADESFKVLDGQDIIINPNAPFDPHVLGQGVNSIDLAYTPIRFQTAEKFPYHHGRISKLLSDPDTKVFGYAIDNDIGFLLFESERYGLSMPLFDYVDIQEIYRLYGGYDRSPSLEDGLKDLKVPFDDFEGHESKDDAEMSMLLLKALIKANGTDLEGLLQSYPSASGNVKLNLLQDKLNALPRKENPNPPTRDDYRALNEQIYAWTETPADDKLNGYGFLFSPSLRAFPAIALPLGSFIIDHRGLVVRNLRETSYYVVYDEEEKKIAAEAFGETAIMVILPDEVRRL